MRVIKIAIAEALALSAFAVAPAHATSYMFTQLPISAGGLNDLGQIVGLYPTPYLGLPVVYDNGSVTSLGFGPNNPPISSITPTAINDTGLIVALSSGGHSNSSFTFQLGTTSIIDSTSILTVIKGENNKGENVGYNPPFGPTGSIGVPSQYSGIFNYTYPEGINDAEQIVGSFQSLSPISGVSYSQGFLLSGGVYTNFVVPGAFGTYPVAINNDGEIVGTFYDASGVRHGFEDENGVFSTIAGPNGGDFLPVGLNNLGQIIGTAGQSGEEVSYLGTPQTVPEPSTLALLSASLMGLLGWRFWSGKRDARPIKAPAIR